MQPLTFHQNEPVGDVFADFRPDACFHLAAQADVRVSVARPDEDAMDNVIGTIHVLQAAQEHGAKVVFSSTQLCAHRGWKAPAASSTPHRYSRPVRAGSPSS